MGSVYPQRDELHENPWRPDGGAGSPQGLTEGVLFDEWYSSKLPTKPPLPLCGTSPNGGSKGVVRIRLGTSKMVFCVPRLTPPARCAASPFRGGWFEPWGQQAVTEFQAAGGSGCFFTCCRSARFECNYIKIIAFLANVKRKSAQKKPWLTAMQLPAGALGYHWV